MDRNDRIEYNTLDDLIMDLSKQFPRLDSSPMKDLIFYMHDFRNTYKLPKGTTFYIQENISIDGLELVYPQRISQVTIEGIDKFKSLPYSESSASPVVVVKGNYRSVIVFGEMYAIESYKRSRTLKAVTIDIGIFEPLWLLRIPAFASVFLIPYVESMTK